MKNKQFYYKGDLARYTGKSEVLYGARVFEIVMLEGHNKGKKFETYRCPDCGEPTPDTLIKLKQAQSNLQLVREKIKEHLKGSAA